MNPPDDWQPPPCKHGVRPHIEAQLYDTGRTGTYRDLQVGRKEFWYDCPTPEECWQETWQQATTQ